jgi:hypothetical protein
MSDIWINGVKYHLADNSLVLRSYPLGPVCRRQDPHHTMECLLCPHPPETMCVSYSVAATVNRMWGPAYTGPPRMGEFDRNRDLLEINGVTYQVPHRLLRGSMEHGWDVCDESREPAANSVHGSPWVCTLAPGHCARSLHIACFSDGEVAAIWGSPERDQLWRGCGSTGCGITFRTA